jgi:hypothetical protein
LGTELNIGRCSDARVVKNVFLAMLRPTPTVNAIADVICVSQPLTFADAPLYAIEPSSGVDVTCSLKIGP